MTTAGFTYITGDVSLPDRDFARIMTNGSHCVSGGIPFEIVVVERKIWTAPPGNQGEWVDGVWEDDPRLVEREREDMEHVQDTWFFHPETYRIGQWSAGTAWRDMIAHVRGVVDKKGHGPWPNHVPIMMAPIGPIEKPRRERFGNGNPIPRCLIEGATWENINPEGNNHGSDNRFRPVDLTTIRMKAGILAVDVSEFIRE